MRVAIILPWIRQDEPLQLASNISILPLATAESALDDRERDSLRAATSTFYQPWPIESLIGELRELARESPHLSDAELGARLRPLHLPNAISPPVILVENEKAALRRAYTAIRAAMFSSIVENHRFSYANSSAFRTYAVSLSGRGYIADSIERMYGRVIGVSTNRMDLRPPHISDDVRIHANPAFLSALVHACSSKNGKNIRRALDNLDTAMSDSPDVPQPLKESLFALATELIAEIPPQKRGVKRDKQIDQRLRDLLDPLFKRKAKTSTRRTRGRKSATLICVFRAIRRKRNSFWHPKPDRRRGPRFSRQLLVAPLVIAVNMTYAIMIARLVELRAIPIDSDFVADVYACTDWLAHLGPELEKGLTHPDDVASDPAARARAMVAWNQASEHASSLGQFRSTERIRAGIVKTIAGVR